jgi:uncharacterized membrane protein YdjX (TVP38/TMEM64 family)
MNGLLCDAIGGRVVTEIRRRPSNRCPSRDFLHHAYGSSMSRLFRTLLLITLVLLVPVLPLLLLGGSRDREIEQWMQRFQSPTGTAVVVVGLLSADVLLPVPSSIVSTIAGARLGPVTGTVASWLGMTLGATLGFAVARIWGRPLAVRLSGEKELRRVEILSSRYGPAILALTRALPILAEASVLLMGLHRLSWWRFVLPVALANLGISVGYAALGHVAHQNHWFPAALGVAMAVPVIVVAVVWRWMPKESVETR